MVRTFLADQIPVEYGVSHFKNQPTPMRVQIRYPVGMLFANDLISPAENLAAPPFSNNTEVASKSVTVAWHFLLSDGSIEDSGSIELTPEISDYDSIKMNGMKVRVSEADEFFLSVPPDVSRVRFQTDDGRLLISGSVRPLDWYVPFVYPKTNIPLTEFNP